MNFFYLNKLSLYSLYLCIIDYIILINLSIFYIRAMIEHDASNNVDIVI